MVSAEIAKCVSEVNLLFTVFTPVYNRGDRVHRVWESLRAQTCRDFEWIAVDDGSTDNSVEVLEGFARQADFPVQIIKKENGGKHTAWNPAVQLAKGELFVPLDSDDACTPEALERFGYWWLSIPENQRPQYAGINVLCKDPVTGQTIGSAYPQSPMTSHNLDLVYLNKMSGEKWGCVRTDVLREVPYPTERWTWGNMSENYLWFQIARRYKTLCVNEALRIYYADDVQSLSNVQTGGMPARLRRNVGPRYFFKNWHLNTNLDYLLKDKTDLLKTLIDVWINGMTLKGSALQVLRDSRGIVPFLFRLGAMPAGLAAYAYCRFRNRGLGTPGSKPPSRARSD